MTFPRITPGTARRPPRPAAGAPDPAVSVRRGPAGYLTGQSSAVLSALAGGPALPAFRRVPAPSGGMGAPSLVHNAETLARVALAARTGAAAHQSSALVTVV